MGWLLLLWFVTVCYWSSLLLIFKQRFVVVFFQHWFLPLEQRVRSCCCCSWVHCYWSSGLVCLVLVCLGFSWSSNSPSNRSAAPPKWVRLYWSSWVHCCCCSWVHCYWSSGAPSVFSWRRWRQHPPSSSLNNSDILKEHNFWLLHEYILR